MASVSFNVVTKRYRDAVGVEALDLQIRDGEMLMLIGPSGCGKTTALRLIAGLEVPDKGRILFDGQDVTQVTPDERNIAMVFEGFALYPHLAVRQNLEFSLRLRKVPKAESARRVEEVARAMHLGRLLSRKPGSLATGQAQSVAVGRAVIRDRPAVLLLDDALAHLDAKQRLEARTEVTRLHQAIGCTIVSVTHDQAEALAVGERVAVMDHGELQQVGTPRELYEQPANLFVAGFIGDPAMNLVRVRRERADGQEVLRAGGLELPLPAGTSAPRDELVAGFRPEDLRLSAAPQADEGHLRGRCQLVEYLGSEVLLHVDIGAGVVIVRSSPEDAISVGDTVVCTVGADRLRWFDAADGRALE